MRSACTLYPALRTPRYDAGGQHRLALAITACVALLGWELVAYSFVPRLTVGDGVAEQLRAETHIQDAEDQEWYQSKRLAFQGEFRP